jgi:hypothetical protein
MRGQYVESRAFLADGVGSGIVSFPDVSAKIQAW